MCFTLLLVACKEGVHQDEPAEEQFIEAGDFDMAVWTYFNLHKNLPVGTSTFGDTHLDSVWAQRTDWDFALCGPYIRTNSGTSGIGKGGLRNEENTNWTEDSLFQE